MVVLHNEFIAGAVFLVSVPLVRSVSYEILLFGVFLLLGLVVNRQSIYSGSWILTLIPLIRFSGDGDLLSLCTHACWLSGVLMYLTSRKPRSTSWIPAMFFWIIACFLIHHAKTLRSELHWNTAVHLMFITAFIFYLFYYFESSLTMIEIILFGQILHHFLLISFLPCFVLITCLQVFDMLCRYSSRQTIRIKIHFIILSGMYVSSLGYYVIVSRLVTITAFKSAFVELHDRLWGLYELIESDPDVRLLIGTWAVLFLTSLILTALSKDLSLSKSIQRKLFHLLAVLVFGVGIWWKYLDLLSFAAFMLLCAMLFADTCRRHNIFRFRDMTNRYIVALCSTRDSSDILLTPIALLIGLTLPIWMSQQSGKSSYYLTNWAGLLTVGVGDSVAAVIGSKFGRMHWPRSQRTVEGSLAGFVSQILFLFVVSYDAVTTKNIMCLFSVTMVEAFLNQVDNLVLPLCLCYLLS